MAFSGIKKEFPIFKRKINGHALVYLDNAATTQKPRVVLDTMREFDETHYANVHRAHHTLGHEASERFDVAHEKIGAFVHANPSEIVITKNATEAINLVAFGLRTNGFFGKGDEILVSGMEHHANLVPWLMVAAQTGAKVRKIPLTDSFELDVAAAQQMISKKTRLVCVSQSSNVLGTINDIRTVSHMAHEAGALMLTDAAQSVPHFKVDVKELDTDFAVWSAHKMCGPSGVGALYGKEELLLKLPVFLTGGEMVSEVFWDRVFFKSPPNKFEAGTPPVTQVIGFAAAVDFLNRVGIEKIAEHDVALSKKTQKALSEIEGVRIFGPAAEKKISVHSFDVEGIHPHDVASVLDAHGIAIRSGNHCAQPLLRDLGVESLCRASFYLYNDESDLQKLVAGIEAAKKTFGR